MNEPSDLDNALAEAGGRRRVSAPGDGATRKALHAVQARALTGPEPKHRRPWGTLAVATGLTGAAVAAAFVLVGSPREDTVRVVPADTTTPTDSVSAPSTVPDDAVPPQIDGTPTPTTVFVGGDNLDVTDLIDVPPTSRTPAAGIPEDWTVTYEFRSTECFRMSLDTPDRRVGSAAGCISPDRLRSDELYVTEMDGEVYAITPVDDAAPPTLSIDSITDWKTSTCGIVSAFTDEAATDSVIEIVACDESVEQAPTALAARVPQAQGAEFDYFAHGSLIGRGDVPLSAPLLVAGLPNVAVFFSSAIDGSRCAAIVSQVAGGWSEQCWGAESTPPPTLVLIDGGVAQIDLSNESAPSGVWLDVRGVPSTGCGLADITQMLQRLPDPFLGSAHTGMICTATRGTVDRTSTLLQNIGADGGFNEYERADRFSDWTSLGGGTAGQLVLAMPIPQHAVWSAWPGQTAPYPASEFRRSPLDGQTFLDIEDAAAAIVAQLDELSHDEFPLDPTVVEIVGDLVVIQSTINDDDSVSGDIDYVFVVQVEGGVTIYEWFRASTCRRGDPGPTELCV
jgi:hypothetical protein